MRSYIILCRVVKRIIIVSKQGKPAIACGYRCGLEFFSSFAFVYVIFDTRARASKGFFGTALRALGVGLGMGPLPLLPFSAGTFLPMGTVGPEVVAGMFARTVSLPVFWSFLARLASLALSFLRSFL